MLLHQRTALAGLSALILLFLVVPGSLVAQEQPPMVIVVGGDSIAAGVGSSLPRRHSFAAVFEKWVEEIDAQERLLVNLARPGESAESFVAEGQLEELMTEIRLAQEAGLPVGTVILSLGGNDLLSLQNSGISDRHERLESTRAALDTALGEIAASADDDTQIVLLNYYDPTDGDPAARNTDSWWIEQFNGMLRGVAESRGALVADVHNGFGDRAAELTRYPADIHPTNQGHRAIARELLHTLNFEPTPPVVTILSPEVIRRETPTVRIAVEHALDIAEVSISSEPGRASTVVPLEDDTYVALLDLEGTVGPTVRILVEVTDETGAVTRIEQEFERQSRSPDQEQSP